MHSSVSRLDPLNASGSLKKEIVAKLNKSKVGKPRQAATLYEQVLSTDLLSRRDRGYFLARLASALALTGEPDESAGTGLQAMELAVATGSQRTKRELGRTLRTLRPWRRRPGPRQLGEALAAQ